ncbi:kinase-like domain-containing protein, partial [Mycena vulgaris]
MTDSSNAHNVSVIDPEGHSQTTQPNSQPSQPLESDLDAWGLLIPCNPGLELVRLLKTQRKIKIGRDRTNHVPLRWVCASAFHAVINWNGKTGSDSEVTITDLSLNGTYIKGEKIGKGLARVLTDGNELSFGFVSRPKREREPEYKYIYRDLVTEDRELYKKYDLSIQLGQGSFARVYKALQKGTSKWVAVKVINQTIRHNVTAAIAEAQLLREIRIMLTLRHPNICELHEFFRNPNTSIDLVLEFVGGGDLLSFITHPKHNDGLTDWMCCHLTFQICKALVYIHSKGITHRDLKPENILLTDEDPPIVKIADFGLAKLVDEATALRTMCGTPTYIAPEIVMRDNNNVPYTNVVDSWSVGVILFVMFTKTTPLPKVPTSQLKELIMKAQIDWDSLDSLKSHIASTPGKDLVRRLLEFEPVTRMTLDDALYHPWL